MIDARDGTRDVVDCGDGTDGALLDQLDELVWAPNCETTGRPDAPAQPQG